MKAVAAIIALKLTGLNWSAASGMGIGLAHVGEFAFVLLLLGAEAGVLVGDDYRAIITLAIGSLIITPLLLKTGLRWVQHVEEEEAHVGPAYEHDPESHALVIGAPAVRSENSKEACLSPTIAWKVSFRSLSTRANRTGERALESAMGSGFNALFWPSSASAVRRASSRRA